MWGQRPHGVIGAKPLSQNWVVGGFRKISPAGRYFLRAEKVSKEAFRGTGRMYFRLRWRSRRKHICPAPLKTPITGDGGPISGVWRLLPARGDRVAGRSPFRSTGACPGRNRGRLPPRGAPALAHPTGRGGRVGSGGSLRLDDGWGCGPKTSAFDRYPGVLGAACHRFGAYQKPPLKREVARRSRDGGFLCACSSPWSRQETRNPQSPPLAATAPFSRGLGRGAALRAPPQ